MSLFMSLQFTLLLLILIKSNKAADLNVGTTLFTKADSCKECWSSESLALLTSRMILEDLLPSTSILLIDSNEFVSDLVEYFRLILEIVRQETHGKTKHITLLALTDLLGGYLYHAVLPIAKYAYYAGLIDYDSMATLLGLFDELKWFLRTNGQGWAKPKVQNLDNFEIQRIPLQSSSFDKDLCQNLLFVEGDESPDNGNSEQCNALIPMPFFDSITRPSAIALPTKTCPLHNVEANTSDYLVMKFFVTSYRCLQLKNAPSENLNKFQSNFIGWIEEQILPRLEDEKFYAAFGGILRVRVTLKKLCASQQSLEKQTDEFHHAVDNADDESGGKGKKLSRTAMILTAILITIFVWFILGTIFICHKMKQTTKHKGVSPESGEKTTTCTSLMSSKYFYPERSKYKKGMSTSDSDNSDLEGSSYHNKRRGRRNKSLYSIDSLPYHKLNWLRNEGDKGKRRHEITITTCRCDHDSAEGTITPKSVAVLGSSHTEGRLPSITEMSESTRSTPDKHGKLESIPPQSQNQRMSKVQKQVYIDSESESEETSGPA